MGCDANSYIPSPQNSGIQGIPLDGRYNSFGECGVHDLYFQNGTHVDTLSCGGSQGMCAWYGEQEGVDPYDESNFGNDPCIQQCYVNDVLENNEVVLGGLSGECSFSFSDGCLEKGGLV